MQGALLFWPPGGVIGSAEEAQEDDHGVDREIYNAGK
jgi:hypothetical protein